MARFLLDTNTFIYVATGDNDNINRDVQMILDDIENEFLLSMESVKELIVAFRKKKLLSKYWKDPLSMIDSITRDFNIRILQVDMEVMRTMAKIHINEAQGHNDPSDHLIIAQAITMRLPLISSDRKFPFYRGQGLDLIENN